jgi:hypothetical protein
MSKIASATSNAGMPVCWFSTGSDGAWPKCDSEMRSGTAISLCRGIGTDQIAIITSAGPSYYWTAARCSLAPIAAPPTNPHSNRGTT